MCWVTAEATHHSRGDKEKWPSSSLSSTIPFQLGFSSNAASLVSWMNTQNESQEYVHLEGCPPLPLPWDPHGISKSLISKDLHRHLVISWFMSSLKTYRGRDRFCFCRMQSGFENSCSHLLLKKGTSMIKRYKPKQQ